MELLELYSVYMPTASYLSALFLKTASSSMLSSLRVTPESTNNIQNIHAQAYPDIPLPAALIPAQKQSVPDFPASLPCIDLRFCWALALWAVIYRCTSGAPSSLQPCVRGNMQGRDPGTCC